MSLAHSSAARNAAATAVLNLLDAQTTAGKCVIETSASAVLATLPLSKPSFGAPSAGVATANAITSGTASATGTAAKASFQDGNGTEVFNCAVAASGSDINLSSVSINSGDTVSITSLTYTAAP